MSMWEIKQNVYGMAYATWHAIDNYAQQTCGCSSGGWNNAWSDQIKQFAEVKGQSFPADHIISISGEVPGFPNPVKSLANPSALEQKIRILGLQ